MEVELRATPMSDEDKVRFRRSPCFICGYNGPGYYQRETHECAARYHATYEGLCATLRADNERLGRERDEARAEVDWWKKSSEWEGDMHDFHKSRSLRLELGLLRTCPQLGISEAWTDDDKLAAIEAHFGISFAPNRLQERTEPRPETARAQAAEAERDTLLAQVARVERVLCDLDPENAIDDSLLRDVHARLQVHGEKYPDRAVSVLHRNVVFYTIQAAVRAALTKEPS